MARAVQERIFANFSRGLITEASGLSFPENALSAAINCVLTKEGYVKRRFGIDFEDSYAYSAYSDSTRPSVVSTHTWTSAGPDGEDYAVFQHKDKVLIFDLSEASPSASLIATVTLPVSITGPAQFAEISNFLVITSASTDPIYIDADDSYSTGQYTVEIRDFGEVGTLDVNDRPSSLTYEHQYDLYNRGWPQRLVQYTSFGWTRRPIKHFNAELGKYPSKGDYYQSGLSSSDRMTQGSAGWKKVSSFGSAPKGHFIIDAKTSDRETAKNSDPDAYDIVTGSLESYKHDPVYPACCAVFAGRVWYAGYSSPRTNEVMFSQIILDDNTEALGRCYQAQDPTDPDFNDLLATDGGVIPVLGCGSVQQLLVVGNSLIVLATNGAWAINGGDRPFSADNANVTRITRAGAVGRNTGVAIAGGAVYWSREGIIALTPDNLGNVSAQNLSQDTIQQEYLSINGAAKEVAKAVYDPYNLRVEWLYHKANSYVASTPTNLYNASLTLDLRLQAFMPHEFSTIDSDGPYLVGGFVAPVSSIISYTDNITETDGTIITDTSLNNITVTSTYQSSGLNGIKYGTVAKDTTYKFTMSEFRDRDMLDWYTKNSTGEDFSAYVETGDDLVGDPTRIKDSINFTAWFERTEDEVIDVGGGDLDFAHKSACDLKAKWEWTDTATANRWHDLGNIYSLPVEYQPSGVEDTDTFDYSYTVIPVVRHLNGAGRALRLRFDAQNGKDMRILGYAITYSVEERV